MRPEERLEKILELLEELEELSAEVPIIVEGNKDIEALKRLGIRRNVTSMSKGMSIFAFCERFSRRSASVIVMTDWDRKGGKLARMLTDAFEANGTSVNGDLRARLAILTKKDIKDIEGLPTYLRRLRTLAGAQ